MSALQEPSELKGPTESRHHSIHEAEWQNFRSKFMQLASEEKQPHNRATGKDLCLYAYGSYDQPAEWDDAAKVHIKKHSEVFRKYRKPGEGPFCLLSLPETGQWDMYGGVSEDFRLQVRILAIEAGTALGGCPKDTDPEDFWFHRLYLYLRENKSEHLVGTFHGVIFRVCDASMTFCSWLHKQAVHAKPKAEESRTTRTQDRDKADMERLLKQLPSESMRNLLAPLTENEANAARLRWEYKWHVAKIARAMGKHRTTIDETLNRAKTKMDSHHQSKTSKTATACAAATAIEDELIEAIDTQR